MKLFYYRKLSFYPVIAIVLLVICLESCSEEKEKIKPSYTPLTEAVYASVNVQPVDEYSAYSPVSGIIKKVLVNEGDVVRKGQPLFQIENDNPLINAENARLSYQLAKDNFTGNQSPLIELENQVATAKLKLANDSLNYARQQNLWQNKIGTQSQLDDRLLAYQTAKKNLENLQNKYGQTLNQLRVQMQQAKNNFQGNKNVSKDFTVTSQLDAKVYSVQKKAGEMVLPQEPLAMLGKANDFIVEMLVDEVDIARIQLGQKALIKLDAYNNEVLKATIYKIYPAMDARTQTFKIEAVFDEPPKVLYPGLTGEANIVIAEKKKVLSIPYEYLVNGNKVLTDTGEVTIKTGLKNFERVEILSGLDSSRFIYKPK